MKQQMKNCFFLSVYQPFFLFFIEISKMHSDSVYKFFSVLLIILFTKLVRSSPLLSDSLDILNQTTTLDQKPGLDDSQLLSSHHLSEESYLHERSGLLKEIFLASDGNAIFDEMFENITEHFIDYSKYLNTASTKDLMLLRVKLLTSYKEPAKYSGAESKFDRFVLDFRPDTRNFDTFTFSTMDFLIFPGLGVENYSATELARIRFDAIQTIPQSATDQQKKEFIDVIDTIISGFRNGKDLQNFFTG